MTPWIRVAGFAFAATAAMAATAVAENETPSAPQEQATTQPPKDCTRFNGRQGYYGNPWCTPEEQVRWDRYEAKRLSTR
jgi:hypothetical protein